LPERKKREVEDIYIIFLVKINGVNHEYCKFALMPGQGSGTVARPKESGTARTVSTGKQASAQSGANHCQSKSQKAAPGACAKGKETGSGATRRSPVIPGTGWDRMGSDGGNYRRVMFKLSSVLKLSVSKDL
jgi:hypothetical protein